MNAPAPTAPLKVGYVVKRYPRFSETFIVNEILAHEAAGRAVEIFSLYPPNDTHFQETLAAVRAPVTYLSAEGLRGADLWKALEDSARTLPDLWSHLRHATGAEAREVYQAAHLARLVKQRGVGHLHAHFASTATEVARLAARFAGIPYTFTAHAKDIFHESVREPDLARKLREAAATITVSDFNVRYLQSRWGSDANRVRRLYNGLDLARFPFAPQPTSRPRVVAVGRLVEKKGFHLLIEACAALRQRGRDFDCVIIGGGEEESRLRQAIAAHHLGEHVQLAGPLPQIDVMRHVREATVFAAPCVIGADGNADGMPTVLLEAMALGTPCVATDVTGIPELLHHEQNGLLVREAIPTTLANALERLLGDPALAQRLGRAARQRIEADFDVRENARHLWETFQNAALGARAIADADAPTSIRSRHATTSIPSALPTDALAVAHA